MHKNVRVAALPTFHSCWLIFARIWRRFSVFISGFGSHEVADNKDALLLLGKGSKENASNLSCRVARNLSGAGANFTWKPQQT